MEKILLPQLELSSQSSMMLNNRLNEFYENVPDYLAFLSPSMQTDAWSIIFKNIGSPRPLKNKRVLEVGAGRSGLSNWLISKNIRENYFLVSQDVTGQNEDYLKQYSDEVFIGNLLELKNEKFDVIFSTYVLEHVTNPLEHLEYLWSILDVNGDIYIFCPRYDFPGYFPPSTRHLKFFQKFKIFFIHIWNRLRTFFYRKPAFLIQTDLACF